MKTLHTLLVFTALLLPSPAAAGDRPTGKPDATRSEVFAQHGMAATSHPLATQAALDVLKAGGTAVDAAIAANALLGVVEPTGSGIGGDLFALVWDAQAGKLIGLNGSGRSPQGLTLERLRQDGATKIPDFGPLPVSVPGCVDGWFALHGRFGKLPIKDVLAPAIRYASGGFPLTEVIAYHWGRGARVFRKYAGFEQTFLPGGKAPTKGEIFRNPGLAKTLTRIGEKGRDAFYKGELADEIDAFCQRVGCPLRKSDLKAHKSEWVTPISAPWKGYEVWELPPNGQGLAALQMLRILEPFDLEAMGHNSAAYLHHLIEAKKLAFADRARFYADPAFGAVPVAELLSDAYAQRQRARLDPKKAALRVPAGDPRLAKGDTVYLCTADGEGNMVSLIQSNYRGFGSGLCPDGLGFCLQDRGALFTLEDGHPNVYAPGKRPFHTIIPAFLTKGGRPVMAFGVMGGDMQPQGHVQVLLNILEFGMDLQEAGDAARFHHGGSDSPIGDVMEDGGLVSLESAIPASVRAELETLGHHLNDRPGYYGGYQAIWWDAQRKVFIGASESRKDGAAGGW
ncbi:MAG: gamma-glutamyltransferase [bacterium]|nr:gamma-glutamyltransferase [bacterium]